MQNAKDTLIANLTVSNTDTEEACLDLPHPSMPAVAIALIFSVFRIGCVVRQHGMELTIPQGAAIAALDDSSLMCITESRPAFKRGQQTCG